MEFLDYLFENKYYQVLAGMTVLAPLIFIALFFVKAGYGRFVNRRWGVVMNNKVGWVLMEAPVFIFMTYLWLNSDRMLSPVHFVMFLLFQIHYFQRSFVFPFLIRGKGRMPLTIVLMGMVFNSVNAFMQGGWIFYVSPDDYYSADWLLSPAFIAGTAVFLAGMVINIHSDYIIRHLRKPGDTRHYIPKGGCFRYVSSANYFGEFMEWVGFAILTWSLSGLVFAIWTFANLGPRANDIYNSYREEFGEEFTRLKLKRILPFVW